MCSYLAMFPPALPRYFIEQCSRPGDVVFDPFSGRGTTPLEACLAKRIGVGSDLNPLAFSLTKAKVVFPAYELVCERLRELECEYVRSPSWVDVPEEIRMLFDGRRTLPQLCYLRQSLNPLRETDQFIMAVLCGILHGNHAQTPEATRTLSISMPNTFSMSPGYIRRYKRVNRLKKYPFDVFEKLRRRVDFLNRSGVPANRGAAYSIDARESQELFRRGEVSLIVSSPPYLRVVRYGKFNWIRLWLLGASVEKVDRALSVESTDKSLGLTDQLPLPRYLQFIDECLASWEKVVRPGGMCVLVIGDVEERGKSTNLADEVWKYVKRSTEFALVDILRDDLVVSEKVTRIWGSTKGAATKTDRILILKRKGGRRYKTKHPSRILKTLQTGANE